MCYLCAAFAPAGARRVGTDRPQPPATRSENTIMTVPSPKSRLQPFAAALALLSALCAGAPASAYADAPAALERGLHAFIRDTYGAWRADRTGWQPAAGDSIYSACATLRVATADGPRMLLAMCGETDAAVANGMPGMDSDGTPGTIDLYVLRPSADGNTLEPVLKRTDIASGQRGEPGTVRIERLGPHLFGFVIGDGTTLQGYTQTSRSIWLPYRNALVEAAPRIDEALDNGGSLDCANAKSHCERRTFAIAPDTTATDDVYPLTVIETGRRGGREIHARYTVKFDAARGRYVVPKPLREGY